LRLALFRERERTRASAGTRLSVLCGPKRAIFRGRERGIEMRLQTRGNFWLLVAPVAVAAATAACGCSGWGALCAGGRCDGDLAGGVGGNVATPVTPLPSVPDTSAVVLAPTPPPALSGGTMLLASDGVTAVVADPDRDTVWWADFAATPPVVRSIVLQPGDEPGRVVEDAAGLVHVALRRAGALATIDLASGTVVRRTPVCRAPRGLAYDPAKDAIIVACVRGELVTLAAKDDTILGSLTLESDLRDPVVLGGGFVAVSKFRTAEVLLVDSTGTIRSRARPTQSGSVASAAWRMVAVPGGTGVALAHQFATNAPVELAAPLAYYQAPGVSVVVAAFTEMVFDLTSPGTPPRVSSSPAGGGLPVDIALATDGSPAFAMYASQTIQPADSSPVGPFAATSIAVDGSKATIAFVREPPSFVVVDPWGNTKVTPIAAVSVGDTGHSLFHLEAQRGGGLACASCHPEGGDDGRVWNFAPTGLRRTPSLVGRLLPTAPFHWDGDLPDVPSLMNEVYTRRMGGMVEDGSHSAAVARFLDALPRVPASLVASSAAASVQKGLQLFESSTIGCTTCHNGPHLTNDATVDVGTGRAFQVPTLIGVGLRAPYMHDGCAATLTDRFGPCGGGDAHGHTSQLSPSDVADLVAFLGTL
jgi:hypothetical protein